LKEKKRKGGRFIDVIFEDFEMFYGLLECSLEEEEEEKRRKRRKINVSQENKTEKKKNMKCTKAMNIDHQKT